MATCVEIHVQNFSSSVEKIIFYKRREISNLQASMLCSIYYIHCRHQINTKPPHFNKHLFCCERCLIYITMFVAIATAIFSHVNLTCYFQKVTWYFIGVCTFCIIIDLISRLISQFLAYYIIIVNTVDSQ